MSAPTIDLNDGLHCPVCEQAFALDDLCSTDIEMGVCHAACLERAAVVDLETGDPTDGKPDVYRFASLFSEAEIDEMALEAFTAAMRDKLARKRDEGRSGWHDKADCTNEHLSDLLRRHVEKGDPVDVANLAMMIHQRGEQIATEFLSAGRADRSHGIAIEESRELDSAEIMGFFARGHHELYKFAEACNAYTGADAYYDRRYVNSDDCRQEWWRTVPVGGEPGVVAYHNAEPRSRGAFAVTVTRVVEDRERKQTQRNIDQYNRGIAAGFADGLNWALHQLDRINVEAGEELLRRYREADRKGGAQ